MIDLDAMDLDALEPTPTICPCGRRVTLWRRPAEWTRYVSIACVHTPDQIADYRRRAAARAWVRYVGRRAPKPRRFSDVRIVSFTPAEMHARNDRAKTPQTRAGRGGEAPGG